MPTEAQINANRLNAQRSTGPKSPAGKAISSLNALKSGIDAWSHIIPGEVPAELEALTAAFHLHFHPADPIQLSLVDTLISAEWTQRRLRRIEAQLWNYQIECLDKNLSHADFIDASIQHNSPLGHAYQDALDPFSRIHRRIDSTNRMYLRTLKALQDLQAAAAEPAEPSPPETPVSASRSPMPTQPLTPQIGFVPQSAPESESPICTSGQDAALRGPTLAPYPHFPTITVISSCCSFGLNRRTSSTSGSSKPRAVSSQFRRSASIRRSSPNSSPDSLNDSVTPSV
jgi:hypothetical protein